MLTTRWNIQGVFFNRTSGVSGMESSPEHDPANVGKAESLELE